MYLLILVNSVLVNLSSYRLLKFISLILILSYLYLNFTLIHIISIESYFTSVLMTENSNGLVILITLLNILVYKLHKLQEAQQKKSIPLSNRQLCRRFSLADIKSATKNFGEESEIGKGGFGKVYKGDIDSKQKTVAIKRAKSMSKQGSKEFLTEIKMLSQFQHSHIISLVGYCDDNEEMILVYDYMPSGSLADHLYKRDRKGDSSLPSLSWVQRLKICIGAAHGLDYLHTGTGIENRVIHRDVKTTNILLDEKLAAKISDFGLSKTGPANQTCTDVNTQVKGTPGYVDPYYNATDRITRKSDVYSFGVVLFEVLSGRQALDNSLEEEQINLARWAQHCFKEKLLEQITDPNIKADLSPDSFSTYVDVAIKCLHDQPKLRPTMSEVLVALESALALQEKFTHCSLPEITPSEYDAKEDVDSATLEVRKTYHMNEKMTLTKTFNVLSDTTKVFLGNKDAKASIYRSSVQSLYSPWPPSHSREKEFLKSLALKNFKYKDLKVATRKFHPDSVIGHGGSACVYKGWIDENTFAAAKWGTGLQIAVKKLKNVEGHPEWLSEIVSLGTHCHPNIVKLIGYCAEKKHRLVVYEYVPGGSLDGHLGREGASLPWNLRVQIALGTAKGLAYLHSEAEAKPSVIHRDVKTRNILIDSEYNAKLSDFGIAKILPDEDTHVSTQIKGTFGYLDPGYFRTGRLTKKSDVYSFGVVLLEILSGRRALDMDRPETERSLVAWAMHYLSSDQISHFMDADSSLSLLCVSENHESRPDTNDVDSSLSLQCVSENHESRPDTNDVVNATQIWSGRRAIDTDRPATERNIVDWAMPCLTSHQISHFMDADIQGQYTDEAAVNAFSLALQCLSVNHKSRPDANDVVRAIEQLQYL